MLKPEKQDQHKIPQVYLKQFGYLQGTQWKVSVLSRGENFTRQKSIKSFTAETNIFDITHHNSIVIRLFESLNCALETEYNQIISELESGEAISFKSHAILVQLVPNFICRSDYWRDYIRGFLQHKNKPYFIRDILAHHTQSYEEYLQLDKTDLYYSLVYSNVTESLVNEVLLFFTDFIFHRTQHYDVVILESPDCREWFTSDNPVLLKNEWVGMEMFGINSEIYLPLSPKYLAYFHFKQATNNSNPLRKLYPRKIYPVLNVLNDEEFINLVKEINSSMHNFLICPTYLSYRAESN
ncbi:DUF4238 domain-containing protein [uncultured Pontibacter sp.]|uniref:DUF4238 domain-containing protein n=1 Tax=uncultured Pontibacter sp. TaxID=453356 RepID=UPI002631F634|nr:DUF4238 domain-containing protein [uncultured Pontibacter sp.]